MHNTFTHTSAHTLTPTQHTYIHTYTHILLKGPYGEIWHSYIKERNQDTKKMEVVKDEYTILSPTNSDARGETLLVVSGDSEIGRLIAEHGR